MDGRGAVVVVARSASVRPGGRHRHESIGRRRAVRPLPDRRLRGVGAPRRRRGLRADVRRRARELGRRAAGPLCPLRDVRARSRPGAHGRPLLLRSLRRAGLQAGQHQGAPDARSGRLAATAAVRARQARHAAAVLPRVRRALRVSRRLPEGPLHHDARRGPRAQLPLPRVQGVLPPRRRSDAHDGGLLAAEPGAVRDREPVRVADARRGRNDPCTCGSGRKWKHCHGIVV